MSTRKDASVDQHLREACADLESRLRSGQSVAADEYLERYPDLAADPEKAVEIIYKEYCVRNSLGEVPSPEAYYRRFPQWQEHLADQFDMHALLKEALTLRDQGVVGRRIGSYEVLDEIARGAGGAVYRARHVDLKRIVAIKLVLAGPFAGPNDIVRFRNEAEAVARLQHPNIVQIFDVGECEGRPFLSLEHVGGGNLAQRIGAVPQPAHFAAELTETLARAVDYAHRQGILHRDLKPANVLLTPDGVPKIADFGLARLLDRPVGQSIAGEVSGTPGYMAPEQASGDGRAIGIAVDIYALGAILYELLTGRPPFRAETVMQTVQQLLTEEPLPPARLHPGVPRDLATICLKCLEKDPGKRYGNAGALAEDLRRFLAGEPIMARPAGPIERMRKWGRRHPGRVALIVVLALFTCIAVGGILAYNSRLREAAIVARNAATEAEEQKALVQKHLDYTRVLLYTTQLNQVEDLWISDSTRALALLEDVERCPPDLRDFSWGLYRHLCRQDRVCPTGQEGAVRAIAIAPDQQWFVSLAGDGTAKLWDLDATQARGRFSHPRRFLCVAISPDGQHLAFGSEDRTIRIRNVATNQEVAVLKGHEGKVSSLFFGTDFLISGSDDGTIRWWNGAHQKQLASFNVGKGAGPVAFSANGKRLAAALPGDTVALWDIAMPENPREIGRFRLASPASCLALSPDGAKLAVAGAHGAQIDLYAGDTLTKELSFKGHLDRINAVAFSPDGKQLASASEDRTARVWEVTGGASLFLLQGHFPGGLRSLAFSRDSRRLATGGDDNSVRVWAVELRSQVARHDEAFDEDSANRVVSLAYTPNGKTIATGTNGGTIILRNAHTLQEFQRFRAHEGIVWSLAFSSDGRLLASSTENGEAKLWDADSGRAIAVLRGHTYNLRSLAFSPDDRLLATIGEEGNIRIWDVATRSEKAVLRKTGKRVFSVGFSPDGQILAIGEEDGSISLFDVATGTQRATLHGHRRPALFVAFSPDGTTLATGGLDRTLRLWDVRTLNCRATFAWRSGYPFSAAYSRDGKTLAVGGGSRTRPRLRGEVSLWDVPTAQRRLTLRGQGGPVAFSPDGSFLATVGQNSSIRLWPGEPSWRK
jgi:WD40 repeat protein